MTIEERIVALLSDPRITALIGEKSYAQRAPQGTALPYVTWQRVGDEVITTHDPTATLEAITIQTTIFASEYKQAVQIRRAIRAVIEGLHADGPATYENPQDITSQTDGIYAVSADFRLWHDDSNQPDPTP